MKSQIRGTAGGTRRNISFASDGQTRLQAIAAAWEERRERGERPDWPPPPPAPVGDPRIAVAISRARRLSEVLDVHALVLETGTCATATETGSYCEFIERLWTASVGRRANSLETLARLELVEVVELAARQPEDRDRLLAYYREDWPEEAARIDSEALQKAIRAWDRGGEGRWTVAAKVVSTAVSTVDPYSLKTMFNRWRQRRGG